MRETNAFVLLFGGESTVRFNEALRNANDAGDNGAKGGRNQELVLAAFKYLLETVNDEETLG